LLKVAGVDTTCFQRSQATPAKPDILIGNNRSVPARPEFCPNLVATFDWYVALWSFFALFCCHEVRNFGHYGVPGWQ
jgi:hypothetical protein